MLSSIPMPYTLKEVADFCYENKGKRGFPGHDRASVERTICESADINSLHIVSDNRGLCGAIIISVNHEKREVYIHHIVAIRAGFATLVQEANKRFPEYAISGQRKSQLKTFNRRILNGR